jgi:hypothetical protein
MFAASKSGSVDAKDPQFNYVTMLLHGDGTNGAQNNTFLDSSTNNFTITRNGNTTQGTFTPYGSNWSNYFGTTTSNLKFASSASFAIGTGNFSIQCSVNFTAWASTNQRICIQGVSGTTNIQIARDSGANTLFVDIQGSTIISYSWTPNVGQWYDVAVVRSGTGTNQVALYIDGVSVATGTSSASIAQNQFIVGGLDWASGYSMQGYISNFRYSNTARTITVPTSPYTSDANTIILTCQSNRFVDNSSNAFAITVNSTPSVQRFSPFVSTTAYSTSVIGGSGYFDGSGDYLNVASQTALGMGSGDFTYEAWIYVNEVVPTNELRGLFDSRVSGATGCGIYTSADAGTTSKLVYTTNSAIVASSTNTIKAYAWTHVAVTRSGTTVRGFLNGAVEFTYTDSRTFSSSAATYIGTDTSPRYFNGFINDVRILKGTAQYTSAFTPSTAPLTAITNTSLLCNFTNAGILDNAMMNDLETVGNAQISTSVKKYGTGSIAFDGTGDWLQAPNNAIYNLGGGDFTIEFWLYVAVNPSVAAGVITKASNAGNTGYTIFYYPTGYVGFAIGSGGLSVQTASSSISTTTWTHVAITRSGTSGKFFINGTQSGSTGTINNFTDSSTVLAIGALDTSTGWNGAYPLNGYIDDLRITKGVARYTANFTAPTAAFADKG